MDALLDLHARVLPWAWQASLSFWGLAAEDAAVAAAVSAEATMRAEAVSAPVVICGFGELGQTVANMLDSPAVPSSCGPCRA